MIPTNKTIVNAMKTKTNNGGTLDRNKLLKSVEECFLYVEKEEQKKKEKKN